MDLFDWLFLFLILWCMYNAYTWISNSNRIERQEKKYTALREEYADKATNNRTMKAKILQKENTHELANEVNKLLFKHKRDIPPRLLDEINKSIVAYIDEVKFDELHDLYKILIKSNKNNVYDNLKDFRR